MLNTVFYTHKIESINDVGAKHTEIDLIDVLADENNQPMFGSDGKPIRIVNGVWNEKAYELKLEDGETYRLENDEWVVHPEKLSAL